MLVKIITWSYEDKADVVDDIDETDENFKEYVHTANEIPA